MKKSTILNKLKLFIIAFNLMLFFTPSLQAQISEPPNADLLNWTNIGPHDASRPNYCEGTPTYWDEQGQSNVISLHPEYNGAYDFGEQPTGAANSNKNTLFVGSITSGLFYSTNGGKNWYDFGIDQLLYTGCSDFEIATYYENGVKKFDHYFANRPYYIGYNTQPSWHTSSMVYTRPHSSPWDESGFPFNYANARVSGQGNGTHLDLPLMVNDIAIAPGAGETPSGYTVLVASNFKPGIHFSTNKGTTWTAANFTDVDYLANSFWHNGPLKIVVDQTNPQIIYLTSGRGSILPFWMDDTNDDANDIYRSTDGGQNFTRWLTVDKGTSPNSGLTMSSSSIPNTADYSIKGVELLQSTVNTSRLFLKVSTTVHTNNSTFERVFNGPDGISIFVSDNSGLSWEYGNNATALGPYKNIFSFELDPVNEDRVYLGRGNECHKISLYDHNEKAFRVANTNSNFHPDVRAMTSKNINGQSFLFAAHDGGVSLSKNILDLPITGTEINTYESRTGNLVVNRGYAVYKSNMEKGKIRTPMPDNSIMEGRIVNGTRVWTKPTGGDGEHAQFSADYNSDAVRTEISSGGSDQIIMKILGCTSTPTVDGNSITAQKNWHQFPMKWVNWDSPDSGTPYKAFFAQSASGSNKFRILYSSENGCGDYIDLGGFLDANGNTIKSRIENLTVNQSIPNLVIFNYLNPQTDMPLGNRIVFGDVSETGNVTWEVLNSTNEFPSAARIVDLEIVLPDPDNLTSYRLYVAFSDGQVYSCYYNSNTDSFSNWKDDSNGLPDTYLNCLAYDQCSNKLFAGTDQGVYYRNVHKKIIGEPNTNGSFKWQYLGTGLPNVAVTDLEIEPGLGGLLYASTWGRGIYQCKVGSLICLSYEEVPSETKNATIKQPSPIDENSLTVYPNPVAYGSNLQMRLSLQEEELVSIQLFDVQGTLIQQVADKVVYPEGHSTINIPLNDYRGNFIILKAAIGKEIISKRIAIVTNSEEAKDKRPRKGQEKEN
ncbi:MAG: hypothetical protein ACI9RM_002076 [Ulvibacter sp.]|jgi:hypothetical protein